MNSKELRNCINNLSQNKIAIFVILYNSEKFISKVLQRIPLEIRDKLVEIFIIDDSSTDQSYKVATESSKKLGYNNIKILRTPYNRGYGGNQKLGYKYAIKKGFDSVILLHGDGQYAPEFLPNMINSICSNSIGAVMGSRMINKIQALKGRMPLYKWLGNITLTKIQNILLKTNLSEYHSGYRAYKISSLNQIPFDKNSDNFHFDTEILLQLLAAKKKIKEIEIPTYYGDEICHVNGIKYALNCIKSTIKYLISKMGIFYEPNFDIQNSNDTYILKKSTNTLHQFILKQNFKYKRNAADLGSNNGELSAILAKKIQKVVSVDVKLPKKCGKAKPISVNLNDSFEKKLGSNCYDYVFALDVIEHLNDPQKALNSISQILKPSGILFASTGNIAYFLVRLSLFFGMFNYGKKGILDLTHKRLYTIYSFKKLLKQNNFKIISIHYFGPPIIDSIGKNIVLKFIDKVAYLLAQLLPSLFAFNFLVKAERLDNIDEIYERTFPKS